MEQLKTLNEGIQKKVRVNSYIRPIPFCSKIMSSILLDQRPSGGQVQNAVQVRC